MGKYKIEIHYATGNSLNSEDCFDDLELTWDDLNVAKDNLQRIKEHYKMTQELNSYSNKKSRDEIIEENKNKPWFVNVPKPFVPKSNVFITEASALKLKKENWEYRPDFYSAESCLLLKADNGNTMQMSAFWIGHFEHLYGAEIKIDNSDMKFEV